MAVGGWRRKKIRLASEAGASALQLTEFGCPRYGDEDGYQLVCLDPQIFKRRAPIDSRIADQLQPIFSFGYFLQCAFSFAEKVSD